MCTSTYILNYIEYITGMFRAVIFSSLTQSTQQLYNLRKNLKTKRKLIEYLKKKNIRI